MKIIRLPFLLFTMLLVSSLAAQDDFDTYKVKIAEAYKLYKAEKYEQSAKTYSEGFASIGRKAYGNDRYNAACSYALAGEKDTALYHLYRLADGLKYTKLDHLLKDKDLVSLHQEKQWDEIVAYVKANKAEKEKNLNVPLARRLDTIFKLDQDLRLKLPEVREKHGWGSQELKDFWVKINHQDSLNEAEVTAILDKYGWLGADVVGDKGNSTLFLVIQHAPLETQEKYLPMMQQAVKDGKARGGSLALLEDRINLRNGRKQIYGSHYVQALEDPLNVDERRAMVVLGQLADYVKHWDMKWDAEEYLKKLPEYEKILQENYEASKKRK